MWKPISLTVESCSTIPNETYTNRIKLEELFRSSVLQVVEWYQPWVNLAPTLTRYIDKKDEILVCGCGNSEMSVDMFDDGKSGGVWRFTTKNARTSKTGFKISTSRTIFIVISEYYRVLDKEGASE